MLDVVSNVRKVGRRLRPCMSSSAPIGFPATLKAAMLTRRRALMLPLLLAVALMALAVFFVSNAPPAAQAQPGTDYDADDDGLIEVSGLAQLNAIRWDLDGDGSASDTGYAAAFPNPAEGMGCPTTGCVGYELAADLDFDTNSNGQADAGDEYWNNGHGWVPIGEHPPRVTHREPATGYFDAVFEGNGRVISNLYIDSSLHKLAQAVGLPRSKWGRSTGLYGQTAHLGLFEKVGARGVVRNVGLEDVDVSRRYSCVTSVTSYPGWCGRGRVGGLAGVNRGKISGSWVTGAVSNTGTDANELSSQIPRHFAVTAGGLVGLANPSSVISGSYSTAVVSVQSDWGQLGVQGGGLVGRNDGSIIASYAAGRVYTNQGHAYRRFIYRVGGLVGHNNGTITASYSTSMVSGAGGHIVNSGLVADGDGNPALPHSHVDVGDSGLRGTATASYFDTGASGQSGSYVGVGKTTAELQGTTETSNQQNYTPYTGIYADWNVDLDGDGSGDDPWDFGTDSQYPVLSALGVTKQRGWAPLPTPVIDYDSDDDGLIEISDRYQLKVVRWDLNGDGSPSGAGYHIAFPNAAAGMGCPETGCVGYELVSDLDMDIGLYYIPRIVPIGGWSGRYSAVFEGNGHTIENLRASGFYQGSGLFSVISADGVVRNLNLASVNVGGRNWVGGLAGINHGAISNVHVSGDVGTRSVNDTGVGGLVGLNGPTGIITDSSSEGDAVGSVDGNDGRYVGGLVGRNEGSIGSSYSTANAWGVDSDDMGGLVGYNAASGSIRAGYATGDVWNGNWEKFIPDYWDVEPSRYLGGLVGTNEGEITASYSTGRASLGEAMGGLVGRHLGGTVTDSYYDTKTSGWNVSAGGVGKTTEELQRPWRYEGIYANWNLDLDGDGNPDDPWDFGSATQYPKHKAPDQEQSGLQGQQPLQQQEAPRDYSELISQMYQWRNDPQWVSEKPHTDRWDRALLAFGETVSDTTLTPMTAAEAQDFADRGWSRWVDVAAALEEIEAAAAAAQQQGTPNQAPTVSAPIADATIVNESGTKQVSLSSVFTDADGDSLTITAASSDEAVATVSVAPNYSTLTVSAQARGTATITVTAADGNGGTVSDTFTVTVKAAPAVALALADVSGLEVGSTQDVSLSGAFSDADGDALTITAASSDEAIATVSVASDGSRLTAARVAEGTATITVTAQDADGNRVSDNFTVSVKRYAALIAKMYQWRNDPQWSSYKAHTDRWDRALLAFGETVSDTSLTPMTAAEAQDFADRGWSRWVEVAAALKEIEAAPQQQQATPNQSPTVAAAIADATIVNQTGARQVSLSGTFSDGDGDSLTITAVSSNEAVATVSVASDHSTLTVSAQARGTATVTVTAADGNGGTVSDTFTVKVKAAPVVAAAIADVSGLEVGDAEDVSLSGVFSDADGDSLTYSAASSDDAVADAFLFHGTLTVVGISEGSGTITVTAQDADGNRVSDAFDVSVVPEPEQPNRAPTVASAIDDVTIVNQSATHTVSLSGVFDDADGDSLTITAGSSNDAVATASVSAGYSSLTVSAQARGTATITINANDGNGGTASDTFTVTVKAAPVVASAIADVSGLAVGDAEDVSLSGVFSDADGDTLTITASSSNDAIATATVAADGSNLTVTGVAEGTATITVTAQDADGNRVSDTFTVAVEPEEEEPEREASDGSPTVVSPLADISLEPPQHREISLSGVFRDPDGDDLTFSATSSNYAVAATLHVNGSTLTVVATGTGTATITVTAEDPDGNRVSDEFQVTVTPAS